MQFGRAVTSPWKDKVCLNYLTTDFWLLHMTLNSAVRRNPITYSCHARHPDEMDAVKMRELHHRGDKSVFCGLSWCERDN